MIFGKSSWTESSVITDLYDCDHFMTVKAQEESDMYWELKHCSFFQGHMRNIQVKQH